MDDFVGDGEGFVESIAWVASSDVVRSFLIGGLIGGLFIGERRRGGSGKGSLEWVVRVAIDSSDWRVTNRRW